MDVVLHSEGNAVERKRFAARALRLDLGAGAKCIGTRLQKDPGGRDVIADALVNPGDHVGGPGATGCVEMAQRGQREIVPRRAHLLPPHIVLQSVTNTNDSPTASN